MTSWKRTRGEAENFDDWSTKTPDSFVLHTQFCWTSRQNKRLHVMPWDLKLKNPMDIAADALTLPSWRSRMPPMPHFPGEMASEVESEMIEDSFTKVGLRAVSSSDQRLWQDRLSWGAQVRL